MSYLQVSVKTFFNSSSKRDDAALMQCVDVAPHWRVFVTGKYAPFSDKRYSAFFLI